MSFWTTFNSQTLTTIVDETGAPAVTYVWYATAGNANNTNKAVWNIKRITDDDAWNIEISFAWSISEFDNIWDDRATLSYA